MQYRRYYKDGPPDILGSTTVCYYGGYDFTLYNPPAGTVTWSVTGPFTIASASGNTVTVGKPDLSNGGGTLTAKVNGTTVATLNITSCQTYIDGPEELYSGAIGAYEMPYIPNASYSWWSGNNVLMMSGAGGAYASFEAPYFDYGTEYDAVYCAVTVNGGPVNYFSKYVTIYGMMGMYNAYPNPASGILNIELGNGDVSSASVQRNAAAGLNSSPAYDIRLYDSRGVIRLQQRTKSNAAQLNVAHLQEGTYYLHIYDGSGSKPQVTQVMVQH
jgi:hypothetical protein